MGLAQVCFCVIGGLQAVIRAAWTDCLQTVLPIVWDGSVWDDLEFCNFSWSVLWMLTYFAILLGIDNGPCKHICNVVEGNVVCSCLSGYTIMADGISCEGKWLWFTTEMWLKHYYVDLTDCRPQGVFLRVLYFQYCALQMAVQRQNCCLWDFLAEGIAGLLYRWLLKHLLLSSLPITWVRASPVLCLFPLMSHTFLQPSKYLLPLLLLPESHCSAMDLQPLFLRMEAAGRTWACLLPWGTISELQIRPVTCFLLVVGYYFISAALKMWGFTGMKNVPLWVGTAPCVSLDTEVQACTMTNSEFRSWIYDPSHSIHFKWTCLVGHKGYLCIAKTLGVRSNALWHTFIRNL